MFCKRKFNRMNNHCRRRSCCLASLLCVLCLLVFCNKEYKPYSTSTNLCNSQEGGVLNMSEALRRMVRFEDLQEELKRTKTPELVKELERLASLEHCYSDQLVQIRTLLNKQLSKKVFAKLEMLQNPENCNTSKKIYCDQRNSYGLASGIHDLLLCCIEAYRTNSMLIVMSSNWHFTPEGWEQYFQPLSHTCPGEMKKVVKSNIPGFPQLTNPTLLNQLPGEIQEEIELLGPNPLPWWYGQLLGYVLQPNRKLKIFIEDYLLKLNFQSPIVGIHVRRTDKIDTEAQVYRVFEYMEQVENYFAKLQQKGDQQVVKRVFVTTDEPLLLKSFEIGYPGYQFIHTAEGANLSQDPGKRDSEKATQYALLEIFLLARTDFIVCTLSSGFCRLSYELMQYYKPDALSNIFSLDLEFLHARIMRPTRVALTNHISTRPGEIDLVKGDLMNDPTCDYSGDGRNPRLYDGRIEGLNHRTNQTGFYPAFKTKRIFGTLRPD